MSALYRPSNGTEGEIFEDAFCAKCERDREWRDSDGERGDGCDILARALASGIDEPDYPKEWVRVTVIADDGLPLNCGECTAFIPRVK